jgi:hypothetical protein
VLQGVWFAPHGLKRAVGVVLGSWLLALPAHASDATGWLHWTAPAECQNTAEVERRLQFLLGRTLGAGELPPTRVRLGWSAERGWAVRVTVELGTGERERALDAPSCADAFDVVALSLALILDPDFAAPQPSGLAVKGDDPSSLTRESAWVGAIADTSPTTSVGMPLSGAAIGPSPAPAADAADASSLGVPVSGAGAPSSTLTLGVGALTDLRIFPVPQFGGGVHASLRKGAARAEIEADVLASESTRFAGAQYAVNFWSAFGGLRACYDVRLTERLGWLGCAGGELGSLGTKELGGQQRRTQGLWLAAQALTGPEFAALDWLRAFARLRAVTPLVRHEFLLSEGSQVHELPWLSLQIQVGVAADVTEWGISEH